VRNSLFSDYYLEELFPADAEVQETAADLGRLRGELANTVTGALAAAGGMSEAELEDRLIRPVLRSLGHEYLIQTPLRAAATRTPDYLLFASADARRWAEQHREDAARVAYAIAEAKRWDLPLDRRSGAGFDNSNPSWQVDAYLRQSGLDWGILTNGRSWRLYHRETSYQLDSFFEVDLIRAIEDDVELLRFACMFRSAAFPTRTRNTLLLRARAESIEHGARLGRELQGNVYEALRVLAEGLLATARDAGLAPSLPEVRHAAFVYIFRLLFVLYAEARGYLPLSDAAYETSFSLRRLATQVAADEQRLDALSPRATTFWARLGGLFRLISQGSDREPEVAAYDGGLFESGRFGLVDDVAIGDRFLAMAINRLTRADLGPLGERAFVTYRDLGVRELGTIYEGLLEQHLLETTEEYVAVRRGDGVFYAPAGAGDRDVVTRFPAGSLLLQTDRGERRDTGSYYTPEPIVRFMATQAIREVLAARQQDVGPLEAVLAIRVVDPAMGSGHFLVDAVDVLAQALVSALDADAPRDESEIRWARREIVERCIYGVDLNPLAVELTKLSLWLATMQVGKPLSFLDHHIRHGNSVLYYSLRSALERQGDHEAAVPADGLWDGEREAVGTTTARRLVEAMELVGRAPSETIADIGAKREAFDEAYSAMVGVRRFLNLSVAATRDRALAPALGPAYLVLYQGGHGHFPALEAALAAADTQAHLRAYFHWEAEFPEVFQTGRRGFDVVLSNPPYVNAWAMTRIDQEGRRLIASLPQNRDIARRHWDLFVPFVGLGRRLLRPEGVMAFVLPNPANREQYAEPLRAELLSQTDYLSVTDFGAANVFQRVSRQTVIWVNRTRLNGAGDDDHEVAIFQPDSILEAPESPDVLTVVSQAGWRESPGSQIRVDLTREEAALVRYLTQQGVALSTYLHISYGAQISGGAGEEFARTRYLANTTAGMRNPKPFVEGRDLRPFSLRWPGQYLDYQPDQFYGPRNAELFESPKLIVRHLSGEGSSLIALVDGDGHYLDHGSILGIGREAGRVRISDLHAIAAVLNSTVGNFLYLAIHATESLQGTYSHVYPVAIKGARLPSADRVREALRLDEIVNDGAFTGDFGTAPARRANWWSICSALGQRLHEIAQAMFDRAATLVAYSAHVIGTAVGPSTVEDLASSGLSDGEFISRLERAIRGRLDGAAFGVIRDELAAFRLDLAALIAEAQAIELLNDLTVADAFALGPDQREYVREYVASRGSLRGNRLWPR